MKLLMDTRIYKGTEGGNINSLVLSLSKVIILSFYGSKIPKEASKSFLCASHVWSNYKDDTIAGG
jgi:hypothetical protein